MAQRVAVVNTDFIMGKLPGYSEAQNNIKNIRVKWQSDLDTEYSKIQTAMKELEVEKLFLIQEIIDKRQMEIELRLSRFYARQQEYFGVEGKYFKIQRDYINPIQAKIHDAVQAVATKESIAIVLDQKSDLDILFVDKTANKTDEVLHYLGYDKNTGKFKNKELLNSIKRGMRNQIKSIKEDLSKTYESSKEKLKKSITKPLEDISNALNSSDSTAFNTKKP